jgi:hypothetical protein
LEAGIRLVIFEISGALPFVNFKGWGFRFNENGNLQMGCQKIPTLAKPARMGHPVIE